MNKFKDYLLTAEGLAMGSDLLHLRLRLDFAIG